MSDLNIFLNRVTKHILRSMAYVIIQSNIILGKSSLYLCQELSNFRIFQQILEMKRDIETWYRNVKLNSNRTLTNNFSIFRIVHSLTICVCLESLTIDDGSPWWITDFTWQITLRNHHLHTTDHHSESPTLHEWSPWRIMTLHERSPCKSPTLHDESPWRITDFTR